MPCGLTGINTAETLLDAVKFNGTGTYTKAMSSSQQGQAANLATTLDQYNNNKLC